MSAEKDVHNFRVNYYQKLGSTSCVEEKKNLLKLLGSVPLDLRKLEQYCQHFYIPNDFRCELWKILLRITPIYRSTLDYVSKQRTEHFNHLCHMIDVIRAIDDSEALPDPEVDKMVGMYLLEQKALTMHLADDIKTDTARTFSAVVIAVNRMDFSACDTYWISRNLCNVLQLRVHPAIPKLIERTHFHLQKDDKTRNLWQHLQNFGLLDVLPLTAWFRNCFADVLPETTFDRLWDKVISGSTLVLVFVAVALLQLIKVPLMKMKTGEDMLRLFNTITASTGDDVVRLGLEQWQRNGGKLTPSSRASPFGGSANTTPDHTNTPD